MKKPLFNKVCIIGVGLIGGSLGMAIKKRKLARWVVGVVRSDQTAKEAIQKKAVDVAVLDLKEGVKGAELVILCGPVSTIVNQLKVLAKYVNPKTLVIDVGSTKSDIQKTAKKYFDKQRSSGSPKFVGCHPMAGSEKKGVGYANPDLFEGATCFITYHSPNPKISKFWRRVGVSAILHFSPDEHDAFVADVSHLPHILSFALFHTYGSSDDIPVTNPSIRDFARLSKSDPALWSDIILSNRRQIIKALGRYIKHLSDWQSTLMHSDKTKIKNFIDKANKRSYAVMWGKQQPRQLL